MRGSTSLNLGIIVTQARCSLSFCSAMPLLVMGRGGCGKIKRLAWLLKQSNRGNSHAMREHYYMENMIRRQTRR
jgi:hypothetical protein